MRLYLSCHDQLENHHISFSWTLLFVFILYLSVCVLGGGADEQREDGVRGVVLFVILMSWFLWSLSLVKIRNKCISYVFNTEHVFYCNFEIWDKSVLYGTNLFFYEMVGNPCYHGNILSLCAIQVSKLLPLIIQEHFSDHVNPPPWVRACCVCQGGMAYFHPLAWPAASTMHRPLPPYLFVLSYHRLVQKWCVDVICAKRPDGPRRSGDRRRETAVV